MVKWHIGCSGFHYKHWKNVFYPEGLAQNKWFDFYCQHFKTLELNVTFYRFPQLSFLQTWHQKSPDDFSFAVKAPRAITHYKQFIGTVDMLSDFYNTIRDGLQEKLGTVLFQLPPRIAYTPERLDRIINSLDPSFNNVLEPRNLSWWNPEVYNTLHEHHITFCGMSHPLLPDEVIVNNPVVYYRFHGVPALYSSPYQSSFLKKVADQVLSHHSVKQAFLYFNNDIGAAAITNAKQMQQLIL
jgi:uncharacterized protein YecE (DUF72 family)